MKSLASCSEIRDELTRLYEKVGTSGVTSFNRFPKTWRKIARTELKWRKAYLQRWNESDDEDYENIEGDWWCDGTFHFLASESDEEPVCCLECECE